MTIKDVAAAAGLSHQAIYKRIKSRGISLDSIKDKATGELTAEGEALIREIFFPQANNDTDTSQAPDKGNINASQVENDEVAELRNQVEKLNSEVEKLRNQVASLEESKKVVTDERDYLRLALERSQQLQAITAQKIPNPPPALPDAEDKKQRRGLFGWMRRRKDS